MTLPEQTRTYTVEDFEQFLAQSADSERQYELIHGSIVEKAMPTDEHAIIVNWLLYYLTNYSVDHLLRPPGPERRFVFPDDTQDSRQPDVSHILAPDISTVTKGAMRIVPDIIAEVQSPDDSIDLMRDKARFYVTSGVKLVIVVFPRQKIVEIYRPEKPTEMLTVDDTLEDADLLPGFSLPIARLFVNTPEK